MTSPRIKANRMNPLKSGLFARELVLTDKENVELQALRRALHAQLQPTTALQGIGLEGIVCCSWRCKLAVRREMQKLSALLDVPNNQSDDATDPSTTEGWYAAGRQELRSAIRWLEGISNDFETYGVVRQEWKEPMDITFGAAFYESLTKWTPMNRETILAAKHLDLHAKTFGMNDTLPGAAARSQLTIDPNQGSEMAKKLMEQELRHLRNLHRCWEQRASESARLQNAASVDFWRYYTAASRDLHRAVEWYVHLKQNSL